MKKIKVIALIILIMIGLLFSGCLAEKKDNGDNEEEEDGTPDISFTTDDDNTITIAAADPSNISWNDIEITGICDTSELGVYVTAGDQITLCSGTISIKYIPTNSILFTFTFTDSQETPEITFVKDEEENYLMVAKADPTGLNWSDIDNGGDGTCNLPTGTIEAGDKITECYGEIFIRWMPTNTLLAVFEFSEKIPPAISAIKDDIDDTLTIAAADPSDILWSDIEIIGDCNTTTLGTYIVAGDLITDCSGTITMRHISTNTLIGTWDFT